MQNAACKERLQPVLTTFIVLLRAASQYKLQHMLII